MSCWGLAMAAPSQLRGGGACPFPFPALRPVPGKSLLALKGRSYATLGGRGGGFGGVVNEWRRCRSLKGASALWGDREEPPQNGTLNPELKGP